MPLIIFATGCCAAKPMAAVKIAAPANIAEPMRLSSGILLNKNKVPATITKKLMVFFKKL